MTFTTTTTPASTVRELAVEAVRHAAEDGAFTSTTGVIAHPELWREAEATIDEEFTPGHSPIEAVGLLGERIRRYVRFHRTAASYPGGGYVRDMGRVPDLVLEAVGLYFMRTVLARLESERVGIFAPMSA